VPSCLLSAPCACVMCGLTNPFAIVGLELFELDVRGYE
jgi:hypothetical protein